MYRAIDTRTNALIQPGGTLTDHCGHTAKLVQVVNPTCVVATWPEGTTGQYEPWAFSVRVELLEDSSGTGTPTADDIAYMNEEAAEKAYFGSFGSHLPDGGDLD